MDEYEFYEKCISELKKQTILLKSLDERIFYISEKLNEIQRK